MSLASQFVGYRENSYEVLVGVGASRKAIERADDLSHRGAVVATVTSPGVRAALPGLVAELAGRGPLIVTQADGETAKSPAELARVWEALAAAGMGRDGLVIALGGGVVGDLAGFAAASYLRGVNVLQVPTTLLAMVDSSVGGKTGINLTQGKNLAGAFHAPVGVLADTDVLRHLPEREFAAGMAEVIKYGLLGDRALLARLQAAGRLRWDHPALTEIILGCVRMKATIVADDERETRRDNGRALLNLGHTFGHAIEAVAGYGTYLHGEAVAIGLSMAANLSRELGHIAAGDVAAVDALLALNALPTRLRAPLPAEALLAAMRQDKKVRAGTVRFVVLRSLGEAVTRDDVPEAAVRAALRAGGAA